jgi:RNA polymerase sigma-70 factor, ECF subfamily
MSENVATLSVRPSPVDEADLIAALRRGDEQAFVTLVDRYGGLMLRIAMTHVRTRASAEEIVQETWCAVVRGIDRFEGRSSFKTWMLRILTNRAKSRGQRERRCLPFSSLAGEYDGPAVAAERFLPPDHDRWPGGWAAPPNDWERIPEERLLGRETLARVRAAIAALPERQQEVIVLRDVEGWSADEVCQALGVSEGNQRVLLHRARSKVRAALERYFDGEELAA